MSTTNLAAEASTKPAPAQSFRHSENRRRLAWKLAEIMISAANNTGAENGLAEIADWLLDDEQPTWSTLWPCGTTTKPSPATRELVADELRRYGRLTGAEVLAARADQQPDDPFAGANGEAI